jgi:hypothetical protein
MKEDNQHDIRFGGTNRIYRDSQEEKSDQEIEMSEYKMQQNHLKSAGTKRIQTREGERIQLREACDEKENEIIRIRSNQIDSTDFERHNPEVLRSKEPQNKSHVTQIVRHRNSAEDRKIEERNYGKDKRMQTIAEGCTEEFCSSNQLPELSSSRCKSSDNDSLRKPHVCALDSATNMKRLDKIEAIEGWMKIHESEFFNERNNETGNKRVNTPVKDEMQYSKALSVQESCNALQHSRALQCTRLKCTEPAGIQTYTDYLHSYGDATGATQSESFTRKECAKIPECPGLHPRSERANESASIKWSQQGLDSLKYIPAETSEGTQMKQHNYGSRGEDSPIPKTSINIHLTKRQPINPERSQENLCNPITNMNTKCNILEDTSLASSSISHLNCSSQTNNTNEEEISVEPICKAVHVTQQHQQSSSLQLTKRSDFKKRSREVGKYATLEQIEAMIEPKLEEQSSKEQAFNDSDSGNTGATTISSRKTNFQSLVPHIVQVKLGIENQSKIIDKLDMMMKHSEIVEQIPYKSSDMQAALTACSENLVSGHKRPNEIGNTELISCSQYPSNTHQSKTVIHSEPSATSEVNKSVNQSNVSGECSKASAYKQMSGGSVMEQRPLFSPQCLSSQNFTVGQYQASGYGTSKALPRGKYNSFKKPIIIYNCPLPRIF